MTLQTKIRVLFNDAHTNLPGSSYVAQGGPGRFSSVFSSHFENRVNSVHLISLLFSHNAEGRDIFLRKTEGPHDFIEVVYPRDMLIDTFKIKTKRSEYVKLMEPLLRKVDEVLAESKPNVVFLNGFSLSNWIILEAAHRRGIPACIQVAGIWKKEIRISQGAFSSSVRRVFASFEKDVIRKTSRQIFLNEFSREEFFKLHNVSLSKELLSRTSIIPLPTDVNSVKKVSVRRLAAESDEVRVGMVARWDRIKNHQAAYRLAKYSERHDKHLRLSVVTRWAPGLVSKFKDAYEPFVTIVPPMTPDKLREFYLSQDVVIIPSRFDVSPTVLMEAILCGKPVVISRNVGWVSDFKAFGLSSMIFKPGASGKAIHDVLVKLFKNSEELLPKYAKLQEKIIREHGLQTVFNKYLTVFASISNPSKKHD